MHQLDGEPWYTVPMEAIFDIDHWNKHDNLPKLVRTVRASDCWTTAIDRVTTNWTSLHSLLQWSLQQGSLTPITTTTQAVIAKRVTIKPRKMDLLPNVSHCRHPVVYGGGRSAGHLWNDYLAYRSNTSAGGRFPHDVDQSILAALKPAKQWQQVADQCVRAKHATSNSVVNYLALHARVELEMMDHNCGSEMERNLTRIFQQVSDLLVENYPAIQGVFVAVSRDGMHADAETKFQKYRHHAIDNIQTLDRVERDKGGDGLLNGRVHVFECGKAMMDAYYEEHPSAIYYGSLLEQVINFYIASSAKVFVGVDHSSYSTDVWTSRYYMGLGGQNYRYTREGRVELVGNGGLPDPHRNCKSRRAPKKQMKAVFVKRHKEG
jgi:hypothetical protein